MAPVCLPQRDQRRRNATRSANGVRESIPAVGRSPGRRDMGPLRMGSAMTPPIPFSPPAYSHCERVDGEHSEHSYRRVFAYVRYGTVLREAINEPLPFHPDEVRARIK